MFRACCKSGLRVDVATQIRLPGPSHPGARLRPGSKGLRRMADQADWFGAFVERSLRQAWGLPELVRNGDGDFPFGDGSTTATSPSSRRRDSGCACGATPHTRTRAQ